MFSSSYSPSSYWALWATSSLEGEDQFIIPLLYGNEHKVCTEAPSCEIHFVESGWCFAPAGLHRAVINDLFKLGLYHAEETNG